MYWYGAYNPDGQNPCIALRGGHDWGYPFGGEGKPRPLWAYCKVCPLAISRLGNNIDWQTVNLLIQEWP